MGFAFHGTGTAEKEKALALRRLFIKVIFCLKGLDILPDRHLPIGQKKNYLCVLCASVVIFFITA